MDARCGEYCGHMGRGAMGYCTEQVEHSTVKKPETNNLLEHEPFYLQNLMIVMNEYRAERTGVYIVWWLETGIVLSLDKQLIVSDYQWHLERCSNCKSMNCKRVIVG